jgi:hypothetical protein
MEPAAIDALPSGILFADWISQRGCAKSTAYRMRAELGIEPERRRRGTQVEVWLSAADQLLMDTYAEALGRGLSTAEALVAVGRSGPMDSDGPGSIVPMDSDGAGPIVPSEPDEPGAVVPVDVEIEPGHEPPASPMESDGELQRIRRRLAALRDAVELGAPLTTAEVKLLLGGARPKGASVTRGRLRAVRERKSNLWTIEPD